MGECVVKWTKHFGWEIVVLLSKIIYVSIHNAVLTLIKHGCKMS